jgi:hypothetical protein
MLGAFGIEVVSFLSSDSSTGTVPGGKFSSSCTTLP